MNLVPLPLQPLNGAATLLAGQKQQGNYWDVLAWAITHHPYVWASHGDDRLLACGNFPCLIAWADQAIGTDDCDWFTKANEQESVPDWWFGLLGYEQGQYADAAPPVKPKLINTPSNIGFYPLGLCVFDGDDTYKPIGKVPPPSAFHQVKVEQVALALLTDFEPPKPLVTEPEYLHKLSQIKALIAAGQTYELNLCIPMMGSGKIQRPAELFRRMFKTSPAPFATLVKAQDQYLFSASPERFLQKIGPKVWSQPIKGTAPRHPDIRIDAAIAEALENSEKERAENMMIVDLVRNDLARHAIPGSVMVEELIKRYQFQHVHQLISTISAKPKLGIKMGEVIRAAFPMGSMTGAPKQRTMELIADLEPYQRGWFSGSAFYRTPNNDWDMNVVIRSLIYDQKTGQLVVWAGGAITWDADPEKEYQECLLKAKALVNLLADVAHQNSDG